MLEAQQHLAHYREWQNSLPVLQSTSCQNHRVERMWPEVNQRINYPVKGILVEMEGNDEINMTDETVTFCVSWITVNVLRSPIEVCSSLECTQDSRSMWRYA